MRVSMIAVTHKGNIRNKNEDNFYCSGLGVNDGVNMHIVQKDYDTDKRLFFGVFDGIGGLGNGEIASSYAEGKFKTYDEKEDVRSLEELLIEVNEYICCKKNELNQAMGSTAVVISVNEDMYELANVGDSKCFLLRDGKLVQITEDHTQAEILKKIGMENSDMNNVLTQYLGVPYEEFQIEPYTRKEQIKTGDMFLLCSDGLTSMVPEEKILETLISKDDLNRKMNVLLQMALEKGGTDNVTIILLQLE